MKNDDENTPRPDVRWSFEPYHPVEPDRLERVVFTKRWIKAMTPKSVFVEYDKSNPAIMLIDPWFVENESGKFPILDVLPDYPVPTMHDTRIASNMILWLGTNDGNEFLLNAERLSRQGIEPVMAYAFAWAQKNIRVYNCNRGAVARDWLTTDFNKVRYSGTMRDVETLEQVARWLGTENGQSFVSGCHRNIALKWERKYEERRAATRARMEARIDPK